MRNWGPRLMTSTHRRAAAIWLAALVAGLLAACQPSLAAPPVVADAGGAVAQAPTLDTTATAQVPAPTATLTPTLATPTPTETLTPTITPTPTHPLMINVKIGRASCRERGQSAEGGRPRDRTIDDSGCPHS